MRSEYEDFARFPARHAETIRRNLRLYCDAWSRFATTRRHVRLRGNVDLLGWRKRLDPHGGGGNPPPFHFHGGNVAELSIFIDESGHFDSSQSGYYVLSLVFHEQRHSIAAEVADLDDSLVGLDLGDGHVVHSGAAIRGEESYRGMQIAERKAIFTRFMAFTWKAKITYRHFAFRKKEFGDALKLEGALARQLGLFLRENADYFLSFEKVIVYYDNGQTEVTRTLNSVFNAFFFDVDVRNVKPQDYRLFQAADLFCTLELLRAKAEDNALSRSDLFFFRTKQALQKDYLRKIIKKRFGP